MIMVLMLVMICSTVLFSGVMSITTTGPLILISVCANDVFLDSFLCPDCGDGYGYCDASADY